MVVKKIFHVFVGFWFANVVYVSLGLIGVASYFWLVSTLDDRNTPIFLLLPRFAIILGAPLPLAVGFVFGVPEKYVAMGTYADVRGSIFCLLDDHTASRSLKANNRRK